MSINNQAPTAGANKPSKRDMLIVILLTTSLILALTYRAFIVGEYIANDSIALESPFSTTFMRDSGFFSLLMITIFLATITSRLILIPLLLRATAIILILLYCLDVELFDFLSVRLEFGDMIRYGKELSAGISLLSTTSGMILSPKLVASLPFVIATVLFSIAYLLFGIRRTRPAVALLSVATCIPLTGFVLSDSDYSPKAWVYDNFLMLNINNSSNKEYTKEFIAQLNAKPTPSKECGTGMGTRPDIILLVVESLSNYHSMLFSGLNDWTPQFDEIAKQNTYFTHFYANGFTTEHGLISLLTGKPFIPGIGEFSYRFLGDVGNSFPRYNSHDSMLLDLNEAGYKTTFLTTSDLNFSGKGAWLKSIGFQEAYGHDLPAYNGWPRLHFHAAPDEALYLATLDIIKNQDRSEPLFITVETVSSHLPYRSIEGPPHTEEKVIRYVDQQLGTFYRALRASGYFEHGMLFIVSDHRAMTPSWPGEKTLYGLSTPALIPAALVWDKLPNSGAVDTLLQQTDLRSSLKRVTASSPCLPAGSGNFLSTPPIPSNCVYHSMGQQREMIYVRCADEEGLVKLDADNTRMVSGRITDIQPALDQINRLRIPSEEQIVERINP